MMKMQIVYASKTGGTKGLADMINSELTKRGHLVTVSDASQATIDKDTQVVIVAGALYNGHWHGDAAKFVKKNCEQLRGLPVWLVSSGPLDDTADRSALRPVADVTKLATDIGARGTETFGGVLDEHAQGFTAKSMFKNGKGGDFRSPLHIAAWVDGLESDLVSTSGGKPSSR
jgi:menaquinone-dependent protoporphyrinogen oxidase